MTLRFWNWFRAKPKPKPPSRIQFKLSGVQTSGWAVVDYRIQIYVATAGWVNGVELWIDGVKIHSSCLTGRRETCVNSGDIMSFDLIDILINQLKVVPA